MDRASTFVDANLIKKLQTDFVAFAGESHELWKRPSKQQDWFLPMATKVNPRIGKGETPQGFYIAGADGTPYGWYHQAREPKRVMEFLDGALAKFRDNPPGKVEIPMDAVRTKLMAPPDASTSVLRIFCRISPLPTDADAITRGVGRDFVWVYGPEVEAILAESDSSKGTFKPPPTLVSRLARFHLIDFARGQPGRWTEREIKSAVVSVRRITGEGSARRFSLTGEFAARSSDRRHGFDGKMEAEFTVDPAKKKIVRFRGYVVGRGWGDHSWSRGTSVARELGTEPFPVKFALVEADDRLARTLPPSPLYYGAPYRDPNNSDRK